MLMETTIFNVQGMSCKACVGHVARALTALDGVQNTVVSLEKAEAAVIYDPAKVTISQMLTAIEDEGYGASV